MDKNSATGSLLKEETKTKFDALLKQALNSKSRKNACNKSTQNLITNESSLCSSNENLKFTLINDNDTNEKSQHTGEVVKVDVHEDSEHGSFILNKFLNDTSIIKNISDEESSNSKDVRFIKPPVPYPRKLKKIQSSISSTTVDKQSMLSEKSINNSVNSDENLIESLRQMSVEQAANNMEMQVIIKDEIKYERETKGKLKKPDEILSESVVDDVNVDTSYNYEKIIGIIVHKSDILKLNSLVIHPVVKIHIVNGKTGEYINKSDKKRPGVFYYEGNDFTYISPVISEPFNLYEKRSLYPEWEEALLINEDIDYLTKKENHAIIFYEIMDFVSFSVANSQNNQTGSPRGWHKIAWAFLKVVGKDNTLNINDKVRLQLYYPGKHKKVATNICDIFHWWFNKKLMKYPSSLYVSIKGVRPPEKIVESLRSKTPMHGDVSNTILAANTSLLPNVTLEKAANNTIIEIEDNNKSITWSRASYETCKLPNKCIAKLKTYEEGCFVMKFSHNGLYLACAVLIEDVYAIVIYSVSSQEKINKYLAHQGLIYDINWSHDDQIIITASADCTTYLWSFTRNDFIEMLPHPSFVYASEISSRHVIATGCYDEIIRIWCSKDEKHYDLVQEMEGHRGYVTSLCFNNKSTMLYSSDSKGTVIEWKYNKDENVWRLKREIRLPDLKDTVINQILLHPRERRLLIHARDSVLRLIDIKTTCVLHWLQGAINNKFKTMCCFSPCGNYIFAGSENGVLHVWNSDVGYCVATYKPYISFNYQDIMLHCVEYHPHDNILAISHYGTHLPILFVVYDLDLEGHSNVGLKKLQSGGVLKKHTLKSDLMSESNREKLDISRKSSNERIKFEDVIEKIDKIVNKSRFSDCCKSLTNT